MSWAADPVFRLDVLRELDLFRVLPRQQQVQLALWAGELGYKFFNCSILSIARLIIQTLQTRCAFCLWLGGTFSPSLSTCLTPSSLWQGRNTMLFMKNWLSTYFQEEIQPCVSFYTDLADLAELCWTVVLEESGNKSLLDAGLTAKLPGSCF